MATGVSVSFCPHMAFICHEATLGGWHTRVSLDELINGVMKSGSAQAWEQFGEWPRGQPAPWPHENTSSVWPFGKFCGISVCDGLNSAELGGTKHLLSEVFNWEMTRPHEKNVNILVSLLPGMAAWPVWTTCICNRSAYDPMSRFPLHSECWPDRIFCWTSAWVCVSVSWLQRSPNKELNLYVFIKQAMLARTTTLSHIWWLPFIHFQVFYLWF